MSNDAALAPYLELLDLPRPRSLRHMRMSRAQRAAQFAPFQALDGLSDAEALSRRRRRTQGADAV